MIIRNGTLIDGSGNPPVRNEAIVISGNRINNAFMPHGELHAKELEVFVKYGGFTPMEATVAATRDNAFAVGLEGQVREIAAGRLADLIVLDKESAARASFLGD